MRRRLKLIRARLLLSVMMITLSCAPIDGAEVATDFLRQFAAVFLL